MRHLYKFVIPAKLRYARFRGGDENEFIEIPNGQEWIAILKFFIHLSGSFKTLAMYQQ